MTRPDPDAPLNPVSLEQQMVEALNSISQSIKPVSKAYDEDSLRRAITAPCA